MLMKNSFVLMLGCCLLVTTVMSAEEEDDAGKDTGGILSTGATPYIRLIRNLTRQILKQTRGVVNNVDSNVDAVRDQVRQVALDIGQNALGDAIDSMRITRNRARRLLNVVKNSQKSVQSILENDNVSMAVKLPMHAVSFALTNMESAASLLNNFVNAGSDADPDALK